jgi:TonB family protein
MPSPSPSGERAAAARPGRSTQPGASGPVSTPAMPAVEPEKKGGSKGLVIALLALLLAGGGGVVVWKLKGDGSPPPPPAVAAASTPAAAAAPAGEAKAVDPAIASEQGESLEVSAQVEPPTGAKGGAQKHIGVLRTTARHTKKARADVAPAPVPDAKTLKPITPKPAPDAAPGELPPAPPEAPPPPAVFTEGEKPPPETVAPQLVSGPPIEYTEDAYRRRTTGDVVVTCTITSDGRVRNCKIVQKLSGMDSAVVRALEGRRYKPATRAGKAIDLEYTFRVHVAPPT